MKIRLQNALQFLRAIILVASLGLPAFAADRLPARPADLFDQTTVWNVHLTFAADQWQAMEPKGGGGGGWAAMSAGGQRGGGARGSLVWAVMKRGDRNRDGKLDRDELRTLAEAWFSRWNRANAGSLD